jgi:hypothetical protein
MAQFLLGTSGKVSPSIESFTARDTQEFFDEEIIRGHIAVAIMCLRRAVDMNSISPGIELALLVAKMGKRNVESFCDIVLQETGDKVEAEPMFAALLIRLYLQRPSWMDLGSERIRSLLMLATGSLAKSILTWRSTLDDQLEDMIASLRVGQLRTSKSLSELSRKHPIIFLRKSASIAAALESDAAVSMPGDEELRGAVIGRTVSGPLEARFAGEVVQVNVRHWGHSFNVHVWVAFLDVIASCPHEVLFGCGLNIGLLDVFAIYVNLMSVQIMLLAIDNSAGWRKWLGSSLEGSEVRHLLMSCDFITPQEAIESLKQIPEN